MGKGRPPPGTASAPFPHLPSLREPGGQRAHGTGSRETLRDRLRLEAGPTVGLPFCLSVAFRLLRQGLASLTAGERHTSGQAGPACRIGQKQGWRMSAQRLLQALCPSHGPHLPAREGVRRGPSRAAQREGTGCN